MGETIGSALREAAGLLADSPQGERRLEAELLLCETTGRARTSLVAWPEQPLEPASMAHFRALVERRRRGEPIAYIRGHQAFWSLDLRVSTDTLIPRPETELLVELALRRLPEAEPLTVADAGTGSGPIAAALAHERPRWTLLAMERSFAAAGTALENLRRWTPDNASVVCCDWLGALAPRSLDAVISNPPYVADDDPHLVQGDLRFEPRAALAGGPDGLRAIRHLSAEAAERLRPGGLLAIEHGFDQGAAVRAILTGHGYREIETARDLAGLERATAGRIPRRCHP